MPASHPDLISWLVGSRELYISLMDRTKVFNSKIIKLSSDVNDNPPEFASKYYFASIREGEPVGTEVVRLMASSRDTGVNAEITYSIIGGNEGRKFMIKSDTGLVSVAGEIDHERAKEYFLTVQAKDGGSPPLSNHATVNITVMDANDNPPVFTQSSYSATINEKSSVGKEVVAVTATDLDKGSNGIVSYRLVHGDPQGQFEVHPRTGHITLAKRLDREMISGYGKRFLILCLLSLSVATYFKQPQVVNRHRALPLSWPLPELVFA